jgi:hypothetical protein
VSRTAPRSPLQREILTVIGTGAIRRADLPEGHGVTQALNALVARGTLTYDPETHSYRRAAAIIHDAPGALDEWRA